MTLPSTNCHSEPRRGIPTPFSTNCHSEPHRGIPPFLPYLLFCLVTLFITLPRSALAHSQPLKLDPPPGARLTQSPPEIRLTFSEPVHPDATISLFLQDSFTPITGVMAQQDSGNPAQIFAPLPRLSPGTYTVQWQTQSSDGHSITGTYAFNIRPVFWVTLLPWLPILLILLAATLITRRRSIR